MRSILVQKLLAERKQKKIQKHFMFSNRGKKLNLKLVLEPEALFGRETFKNAFWKISKLDIKKQQDMLAFILQDGDDNEIERTHKQSESIITCFKLILALLHLPGNPKTVLPI